MIIFEIPFDIRIRPFNFGTPGDGWAAYFDGGSGGPPPPFTSAAANFFGDSKGNGWEMGFGWEPKKPEGGQTGLLKRTLIRI